VLPFEEHRTWTFDIGVTTGANASRRLGLDYRVLRTYDLARYWFHAPTYELGPQLAPDHVVFSRRTGASDESTTPSSHALALSFREQSRPAARIFVRSQANHAMQTVFHGVSYPSTLEESGSDLRRVYLARLCCVFRLSQTLDALIPPEPVPALFHASGVHGFPAFRGFPSPITGRVSRLPCPSCCFSPRPSVPASRPVVHDAAAPREYAISESVSTDTVLPDECRSILS